MIADLIPLLAFAAIVVIARNLFEAYVLDHEQRRLEAREWVRVSHSHSQGRRVVRSRDHATR
jgi:hypothetical protein